MHLVIKILVISSYDSSILSIRVNSADDINPFGTDCICDPILLNNRFIVGNNLHQKRCSKKLRAIIGDDKDEEESLESIQFEASIL